MNEKASRNLAVLGVLHPGIVVAFTHTPTPDFDGGCRELPPPPPRLEWERDLDDRAWQSVELEDGADWLWPGVGRGATT